MVILQAYLQPTALTFRTAVQMKVTTDLLIILFLH